MVEGGVHHQFRIDVATGGAVLSLDDGTRDFFGADGSTCRHPRAITQLNGAGRHEVRFSNIDDQLLLWIDERLVRFDGPTTYQSADDLRPRWSPTDPGDASPVGIGCRGLEAKIHRLRVLRDEYYVATDSPMTDNDYETSVGRIPFDEHDIYDVISHPDQWNHTPRFDRRRSVVFTLGKDQFFPMGDKSPQSRDARIWGDPAFVSRKLLVGKALFVYWPHAWRWPTPLLPNFRRFKFIR